MIQTSRETLGLDEAGRGPILGPLVVAGVCLSTRAAALLCRRGVVDSKSFGAGEKAHERRSELAQQVLAVATSVVVRVIDVAEIDRRVERQELNMLEREHATAIIHASAPADRIIADGARMFGPLTATFPHLRAVDRGEAAHTAVAAASLLAKVRRDELFQCIAQRYAEEFGPIIGGGYPNDATRRFLRAYIDRHGDLPPEARRSWSWDAAALPDASVLLDSSAAAIAAEA